MIVTETPKPHNTRQLDTPATGRPSCLPLRMHPTHEIMACIVSEEFKAASCYISNVRRAVGAAVLRTSFIHNSARLIFEECSAVQRISSMSALSRPADPQTGRHPLSAVLRTSAVYPLSLSLSLSHGIVDRHRRSGENCLLPRNLCTVLSPF